MLRTQEMDWNSFEFTVHIAKCVKIEIVCLFEIVDRKI